MYRQTGIFAKSQKSLQQKNLVLIFDGVRQVLDRHLEEFINFIM